MMKRKPPMYVIDQQPAKGAKVKENRKNLSDPECFSATSVKVPNIMDNSKRQAELILSSWGLKTWSLYLYSGYSQRRGIEYSDRRQICETGYFRT